MNGSNIYFHETWVKIKYTTITNHVNLLLKEESTQDNLVWYPLTGWVNIFTQFKWSTPHTPALYIYVCLY